MGELPEIKEVIEILSNKKVNEFTKEVINNSLMFPTIHKYKTLLKIISRKDKLLKKKNKTKNNIKKQRYKNEFLCLAAKELVIILMDHSPIIKDKKLTYDLAETYILKKNKNLSKSKDFNKKMGKITATYYRIANIFCTTPEIIKT